MTYQAWGTRVGGSAVLSICTLVVYYGSAFAINILILLYAWVFGLSTKSWLSYTGAVGHRHVGGYWPDWAVTGPVKIALVVWPTFIVLDLIIVSTWRGIRALVRT